MNIYMHTSTRVSNYKTFFLPLNGWLYLLAFKESDGGYRLIKLNCPKFEQAKCQYKLKFLYDFS